MESERTASEIVEVRVTVDENDLRESGLTLIQVAYFAGPVLQDIHRLNFGAVG